MAFRLHIRKGLYSGTLRFLALAGILLKLFFMYENQQDASLVELTTPDNTVENNDELADVQDRILLELSTTRNAALAKADALVDKMLASSSNLDSNTPPIFLSKEPIVIVSTLTGHERVAASKSLLDMAISNRDLFASSHVNYKHHYVDLTDKRRGSVYPRMAPDVADPGWLKIQVLREAFKQYPDVEWFWWLDLDAIILNKSLDIYQNILNSTQLQNLLYPGIPVPDFDGSLSVARIFPPPGRQLNSDEIDLILSQTEKGIDLSSFFIRSSTFTKNLLDIWESPLVRGTNYANHEVGALDYLLFNEEELKRKAGLVSSRLFASHLPSGDSRQSAYSQYKLGDLAIILDSIPAFQDSAAYFTALWNQYQNN